MSRFSGCLINEMSVFFHACVLTEGQSTITFNGSFSGLRALIISAVFIASSVLRFIFPLRAASMSFGWVIVI